MLRMRVVRIWKLNEVSSFWIGLWVFGVFWVCVVVFIEVGILEIVVCWMYVFRFNVMVV